MHDEHDGQDAALTELRKVLKAAMACMRLNQTDLATRAGLGRTTVSEALSPGKPAPSSQTVAALARALQLPVGELLELQRSAAEGTERGMRPVPGRPISEWDPHDLEVHPAGPGNAVPGPGRPGARAMPGYVRREHDRVLAELVKEAAAGHSRAVVLVGSSSTGKTRACWEAVQPLTAQGWRLWHPFDPTRAQDALEDLPRVWPRTVVWLNEAQHYLGDRTAGEQIAAAVHQLLMSEECGPVLVLGTLWPEYAARYTALPAPGAEDPHSRVRELLAGRMLTVPEAFDAPALTAATALAEDGDRLWADALSRAGADGRLTQDHAGAPELLNRYRHATPAAAAVLEAAMDARRLGVGLHLPQEFLTDAAADYLTDTDYDQLTDDWAEQAFAELAALVHGKQAPLRRTTPRTRRRPPAPPQAVDSPAQSAAGPVFRLADYLEQHGRTHRKRLCPPASFWHAAHAHLTDPNILNNLTREAENRQRLQWAHSLRERAADHGSTDALSYLALKREEAGDRAGAEALAQQAADHGSTEALFRLAALREEAGDRAGAEALAQQAADHGSTDALYYVAMLRKEAGDRAGAEVFYRQAADRGNTDALTSLAMMWEEAGDRAGAEVFYRQAADHGNANALFHLAMRRKDAGDREGAEALAQQAADHGSTEALFYLAALRKEAGDQGGAEALYRQVADRGNTDALTSLAALREEAGDREGAEALARQVADHGSTDALFYLAELREEAGDQGGAEALAWQVADHGSTYALFRLAALRERAGDQGGAEALARQVADHGSTDALFYLAELRKEAGDQGGAEALYRHVADHGNIDALFHLALKREKAGDRAGAEVFYRQAADHGNIDALTRLAEMREEAGDREGAEALAQQAADHGTVGMFPVAERSGIFTRLWPYGLDPDGTPTSPWRASVSIERNRHLPPGTV
ncbi:helix-turn-helix domain-containing protein [Streptomyces hesseae]|uniref:Helix-turn-helix domain-containing protein n=1 Tax=Streptomyces hesseae TaxID=3075519 RepID=A0ABU2SXK1_9ACTN|nr:helix-turn-helix domain-containing protein [Streptomyces sp. DSM 40473]MDT0453729.1 helix-turn-helix domain-containing protein [Streptomyces sp. DSM 40473]